MFSLDDDVDPKLRSQVLLYAMAELLTDRERARLLGLPEGCRIRERAKILAQEKLTLGKHVWIGEGAVLDAQGGLSIGDYTQIGLSVMVWSHSSHQQAIQGLTGSLAKEGISYRPTRIGKNCFIAGPSVIAPGVTIGDRVIVSPLTLVDRDLADDVVVGGNRGERELRERVERLEGALTRFLGLAAGSGTPTAGDLSAILADLKAQPK